MKVFEPIGYFNDPEDITSIFPSSIPKSDEADMVFDYYENNYGVFHSYDFTPDVESCYTRNEMERRSDDAVIGRNGEIAVIFTKGDGRLLRQGNDQHGFYIDLYRLVERPDYDDFIDGMTVQEPLFDITKMSYNQLLETALDLTKKMKEVAMEIKRRKDNGEA